MALPETYKQALNGLPIGKLIEHPLVDGDLIVTKLTTAKNGKISVSVEDYLVPIAAAGIPEWRLAA